MGGQKATRGRKGGGRDGGSKGTRKETKNLRLKKVTDEYGLLKIRFEFNDKGTMLHLGENSAGWSNLVGELVREYSMYYPSCRSECSKLGKEQGLLAGRDPAVLRDQQIENSVTREYPSLIQTFFDTHTYGGEFAQDEARVQYEEMLRLRDLGANTPTGVPYTEEQIMAMMLTELESQPEIGGGSGSGGGGDDVTGGNEDAGGDEEI
ncbi:hypothetical protein Tco_1220186 [Tanacetum coccineum]